MFRCGAATAACHIDIAALCEFLEQTRGNFGGFIKAGLRHRIGKSGIRVDTKQGIGFLRKLLHIGAHQSSAKGAIQADR